jgi:hypothetical protein
VFMLKASYTFFNRINFLVLAVLFSTSCSTTQKIEPTPANWYSRMHRISAAATDIMPLAGDAQKFLDPQNNIEIQSALSELADASAQLAQDTTGPKDPIIQHTAKIFAQDMAYAKNQFQNGNTQVAHAVIGGLSNYCISCHTRSDRGTKNFPLPWVADLKGLNDIQKTQFYLANRQYDAALKEVNKVVSNPTDLKNDIALWRLTIEKTLALLIRVEKNVDQSFSLVQSIVKNSAAPYYIRYDAYVWLKDINAWKKDQTKNKKELSDKQKYTLASRLIDQGKIKQKPQSHSALISSLRASALLHEVIENPKSKYYADSLYYAGISSELLRDISVWSLNETYYESCIRASPHTRLSEKCYVQLEASVHQAYPNTMVNPVMSDVQQHRLDELSKLAMLSSSKSIDQMYRSFDIIERSQNRMDPGND